MSRDLVPMSEYRCPFVMDMTDEKARFCYEYAIDLNPQLAAERCGITVRKARKWLRDPMVKKAVSDIKSRVLAHCELSVEDITNELKRIAFFDIKGIVKNIDKNGKIEGVDFKDIDGRAISEITIKETKTGRIILMQKPHRKTEALKILLDHATNANQNNVNVQVNISEIKSNDPEKAMDTYQKVMGGAITSNGTE